MDDDCENDNYQSPFGRFMQKTDDKEVDSFNSLTDFIKAHAPKSNPFCVTRENVDNKSTNLLSTLSGDKNSSLLFNNDNETCHNLSSYVNNSLKCEDWSKSMPKNSIEVDNCEDFGTLEEYTKSFLHSRGTYSIPTGRFRTSHSESSESFSPPSSVNSDLKLVGKKLSRVHISNSNDVLKPNLTDTDHTDNSYLDNWNIDLSLALQDSKTKKLETAASSKLNKSSFESSVYSVHAKECTFDISRLANEKLLYNNAVLSSFGYVLSRKWKKIPLSKKCRKIGVNWPYKRSKSFKFDSPSPDDVILKNKSKMRTTSLNDA